MFQTDLASLLSSMGQRHALIAWRPSAAAAERAGSIEALFREVTLQRIAVVWQVNDEALWKRLIQAILASPLAAGGLRASEEQGFSGIRPTQGPVQAGLFVGRGYLVFGLGPDVVEQVLAVLRNPPQGSAALRGSDVARRSRALLPPQAGLAYSLSDTSNALAQFKSRITTLLELVSEAGGARRTLPGAPPLPPVDEGTRRGVDGLKTLLPSDEELAGITGASVSQMYVNQHGVVAQGALELAPAR
jgi:hypothetical protein